MGSIGWLVRGGAVALTLSAAGAARAGAQQAPATFVGMVRDSGGMPIAAAEVRFMGADTLSVRTNDSGGFRLPGLPVGPATMSARRMGFSPATTQVIVRAGHTDSLVFTLTALATTIAGVLVEDEHDAKSRRMLAGFWERRSRGFGYFLTRDDIVRRDARDFVDLTRMMPSVTVAMRNGRPTIRFTRSMLGRDCPPQYVVDGMRIENGSPDEFVPEEVEALEVYSGPSTIPPQFAPRFNSFTCGAIVIWTRLPGT